MSTPLSPPNTWVPTSGCTAPDSPSIAYGITLTGVPAMIGAAANGVYSWSITLNDGGSPANFSIDRYDSSGNLIDHPVTISGADGSVRFADPVFLPADPMQPLGAATKQYVDAHTSGAVAEAPIDGASYVRNNGSWFPMGGPYLPLSGGAVTGSVSFSNASVVTINGSNNLVLNGAPGASRGILGMTANVARWQLVLGDGTVEAGNAGANFTLAAYSATGSFLFNPITIARATGVVAFSAMPSIPGGVTGQVLTTNGAGGLHWGDVSGGGGGIPDAPNDGQLYGRQSAAWTVVPSGGGGGIPDAPNDGTMYGRKAASWAHLTSADITDLTGTLAPYALTSSLSSYALISSVPLASTSAPLMDGTSSVGIGTTFARADHVHPSDTSRYAASNPSGFQTAAQVTSTVSTALGPYALSSSLPPASNALPIIDGTAAAGTATAYARADHVHPAPVIPAGGDTLDIEWFGDGSDSAGAVTTSITLTRDMYYSNLTISGAGVINCNGWRIFVSGVLDLSAAGVGAISGAAQTAAVNATTFSGGNGGFMAGDPNGFFASTLNGTSGGGGGNGGQGQNSANGGNAPVSVIGPLGSIAIGGQGGPGGAGGPGSGASTGGTGGTPSLNTGSFGRFRRLAVMISPPAGKQYVVGGPGGGGGGGGGNGGTSTGGGGGGGANGTAPLIFARTILRGAATAIGAIYAVGGQGGNGGPQNGTAVGSGGGGGGGGGGFAYLVYRFLTGAPAPNAINASGGNGGNAGTATTLPGVGGTGGQGGTVVLCNVAANTIAATAGPAGSAGSGVTGGAGGACLVTL